jgi:hypothetical protein
MHICSGLRALWTSLSSRATVAHGFQRIAGRFQMQRMRAQRLRVNVVR